MERFAALSIEARVAILTLSRPEQRNAIASHADCDDIVEALHRADAHPEVAALIVTGAGTAFCAGGDLKAMHEKRGIGPLEDPVGTRGNYRKGVQRIPLALAEIEIATIAAVNGPAIGLGCDIAAYCDIRIAAQSARFASSFVKVGLIPGDGGAWILQRVVGFANAAEMILTGDMIKAEEALAMGLVSKVVPDGQLLDAARALAARIAVNPVQSVRLAKRLLREGTMAELPAMLQLSAAFQALMHETSDYHEAVNAFVEKRQPKFTNL